MRSNLSVNAPNYEYNVHKSRLLILVVVILCFSCLLIARLAYLQLAQFKRYETLSLKNQMSIIPIAPPRGIILDSQGVVLAENIPVYVLEIIPEHVSNLDQTLRKLQILLPSITEDDIVAFKHARKQNRSFVSIPLKLKLTQEEVALFASNQYQFPGVSIKARLMRYYPLAEMTAHVLGYVGRINIPELQQVDSSNYRATNFIGKAGIEKYYEKRLHGKVGYQQVETDVSGRTLRILRKKNPISGENLYLSLDSRLQKVAFEALKDKRGAVVALNAKNGEVLAMVSSPSYDPNIFVNGISSKDYQQLANSKDRPLYNRAVRGLYPPASTIKPFIAITGLENGVVDTRFQVYDPGWFKLPNSTHAYRDWKKTGHGTINLSRAIMVSCDTYFYQLGHRLGIAAVESMLRQFGFGELTQVDLREEAPGLLPSASWKRQKKGVAWYPGDTLITAIGQGFMLASPLQLANATVTMSQKGQRFRPHILRKSVQRVPAATHPHTFARDETRAQRLLKSSKTRQDVAANDGGEALRFREKTHRYRVLQQDPIVLKDAQYWTIVAEAMHSVITSNEGTGYRFGRTAPYSVAAKTGTAQVFGGKHYEKKRQEDMPEFLRDHSLFIAFAPVENPQIALAVMVENDVLASNVARKVLDAYFQLHKGAPI